MPIPNTVKYTSAKATSDVATVDAAGFEPLFIDVDPSTWQPDTDALTAALGRFGDDVAAVLGTSTFGTPAPAAAV